MQILLIEYHPILMIGFRKIISNLYPDAHITQVNISCDVSEILQKVFDIVVVNLPNDDEKNFRTIAKVRWKCPRAKILVYADHYQPDARASLRAGANGILSQGASEMEIESALDQLSTQKYYLSQDLMQTILLETIAEEAMPNFTKKELRAAKLFTEFKSDDEISRILHIRENAVSKIRRRVYGKVGAKNAIDLSRNIPLLPASLYLGLI